MKETSKPFLPRTIEMTPEELNRAHEEPVIGSQKPSLKTNRDKKPGRRGVKDLIGAAVVAWAGSSFSPADVSNTREGVEAVQPQRKVPIEHEVDSAPWITMPADAEKVAIASSVEARARSRRVHTWETYLKFLDRREVDASTTRVSTSDRDRIIYNRSRIERLQTNIAEKNGPEFLNRVTQIVAESCRGIILNEDLPKTQEEAGVVIDTAIERALRLAYVQAQAEGWKGVNLMLADTQAMRIFSETIREFAGGQPELAHRNYSVLFRELRNRAYSKLEMEQAIPDLRRASTDQETGIIIPEALPETEALDVEITQHQFDLLGQSGERVQLEYLQMNPRAIRVLAAGRLAWFEQHREQIAVRTSLKEQVIREFSHVLDRQYELQNDPQLRERLFHLRTRLLRAG